MAAKTVYSNSSGDDEELLGSSSMGTRTDWWVYPVYLVCVGRNNFGGYRNLQLRNDPNSFFENFSMETETFLE